jgi:hypothetical protein
MDDELVRRRRWLSREKFLDLLGASNLIPGPSSSELAIHIGYLRAGWIGLIVAGTCFIFPAAVIVAVLAWFYVRFGSLPVNLRDPSAISWEAFGVRLLPQSLSSCLCFCWSRQAGHWCHEFADPRLQRLSLTV